MTSVCKWFFTAVITVWIIGFAAFTICWKCDRWLPEDGLHVGDARLAEGEQFRANSLKLKAIDFAWGNAQKNGYFLRFWPDNRLYPPVQFIKTWNWKRSDHQVEPDPTLWFAAPSRCDSDWKWQAAGIDVATWHDYGGNFQDEREQQTVWTSPPTVGAADRRRPDRRTCSPAFGEADSSHTATGIYSQTFNGGEDDALKMRQGTDTGTGNCLPGYPILLGARFGPV